MAKKRANGEGNIRKRKDGRWEGRYTAGHDANGKAIYKNVLGKTQAEVKEKLKRAAGRTIVGLLKEHIADAQLLELSVEGSLSTPTVVAESRFTHFNIIYRAECKTLKEQIVISRAINLAHDKYCGMLQMIRQIAPMSHETSIVTTQELSTV